MIPLKKQIDGGGTVIRIFKLLFALAILFSVFIFIGNFYTNSGLFSLDTKGKQEMDKKEAGKEKRENNEKEKEIIRKKKEILAKEKKKMRLLRERKKRYLEARESDEKDANAPSVFYNGSTKKKQVALTFDDGPNDHDTQQVLNLLNRENIQATFFVVGSQVRRNPELTKQVMDEGHVIASHSWSHSYLPAQSQIDPELDSTYRAIKKATGKEVAWFRPPYGALTGVQKKRLSQKGYWTVNWNVDTLDWKTGRTADQVVQAVKSQASPGSIILMHDGGGDRSTTVQALPQVIQYLKDQGYEFVTVDKLFNKPAYRN
ncbi:polysaccharide deacetylase family protein [Salinithrix halophila]|uniref:Polysaccharide deacetylase family protein n=1 Tax=Salinithrix halophila TaxID=1485204 RepID=A0ABV8JJZ7_9BACL